MEIIKILFIVTLAVMDACSGYRILAIYAFEGRSHFILINQLLRALANKGHQVDLISQIKIDQHPNYRQIIDLKDNRTSIFSSPNLDFVKNYNKDYLTMFYHGNEICRFLKNPKFIHLAHNPPKDPPYDMIITHVIMIQ